MGYSLCRTGFIFGSGEVLHTLKFSGKILNINRNSIKFQISSTLKFFNILFSEEFVDFNVSSWKSKITWFQYRTGIFGVSKIDFRAENEMTNYKRQAKYWWMLIAKLLQITPSPTRSHWNLFWYFLYFRF